MTPMKCWKHEQRLNELGDSPRYLRALVESRTCWRCRMLAVIARVAWSLDTEEHKRSERTWRSDAVDLLIRLGDPLLKGPR